MKYKNEKKKGKRNDGVVVPMDSPFGLIILNVISIANFNISNFFTYPCILNTFK